MVVRVSLTTRESTASWAAIWSIRNTGSIRAVSKIRGTSDIAGTEAALRRDDVSTRISGTHFAAAPTVGIICVRIRATIASGIARFEARVAYARPNRIAGAMTGTGKRRTTRADARARRAIMTIRAIAGVCGRRARSVGWYARRRATRREGGDRAYLTVKQRVDAGHTNLVVFTTIIVLQYKGSVDNERFWSD